MEMIRFIKGTEKEVKELEANLFARIITDAADGTVPYQALGSDEDGWTLKVDLSYYNEMQLQLIETAIKARMTAGVLSQNSGWVVDEALTRNSFCLTADSQEKLEIILNDILRGAKIPEENIQIVQQPFAPGMTSTLVTVILAFNLSEDQMKAVELSAKVAKQGIKVQNFAKKTAMVATTTANVTNRVGRDVLLAGTEVVSTLGAGAIKTGVEMIACATNIGIRELNPKELVKGDNVQSLAKTLKTLWKKDDNKVTNGFASL